MKLISWNVNGLRACMGKNFMEDFQKLDADIFCLQETKLQEGQIALDLPAIISTGITRKRRDTAEPPFLQRKSLCPSPMESESKNTTMKAA